MKITLDTTNKVITLIEAVNLGELLNELGNLSIDYNEYKLDIVEPHNTPLTLPIYPLYPTYPTYPTYFTDTSGSPYMLYSNTTCENKKSQH